jgi:hypothetical protein
VKRPTKYEYDKFPCGCYLWYYDPGEVDAYIADLERQRDEYKRVLDSQMTLSEMRSMP